MSDAWYYADGNKPVGPLSLADLTAALSRLSDAKDVSVWRKGFAEWVRAETVPELAGRFINPPALQELEPTFQRTLSVWWLIVWRSILGAMVAGFVVGAIAGILAAITGVKMITYAGALVGLPIGLAWHVYAVQMALRKRYRDFRIVLVPHSA